MVRICRWEEMDVARSRTEVRGRRGSREVDERRRGKAEELRRREGKPARGAWTEEELGFER